VPKSDIGADATDLFKKVKQVDFSRYTKPGTDLTTPLPSSCKMIFTGLASLGFVGYRQQKKRSAFVA